MFDRESNRAIFPTSLADFQTFPIMCVMLLAAGLSLLNNDPTLSRGARIGPVVLFIYLFTIALVSTLYQALQTVIDIYS